MADLTAHAAAEHPLECCGLLAGHATAEVYTVTTRIPLTNHLNREDEFESDPVEMLKAQRGMRQAGLDWLAVYHSHPAAPAVPSRKDRTRSIGVNVACVIVGPHEDVRAWWLVSEDRQEEAEWEAN